MLRALRSAFRSVVPNRRETDASASTAGVRAPRAPTPAAVEAPPHPIDGFDSVATFGPPWTSDRARPTNAAEPAVVPLPPQSAQRTVRAAASYLADRASVAFVEREWGPALDDAEPAHEDTPHLPPELEHLLAANAAAVAHSFWDMPVRPVVRHDDTRTPEMRRKEEAEHAALSEAVLNWSDLTHHLYMNVFAGVVDAPAQTWPLDCEAAAAAIEAAYEQEIEAAQQPSNDISLYCLLRQSVAVVSAYEPRPGRRVSHGDLKKLDGLLRAYANEKAPPHTERARNGDLFRLCLLDHDVEWWAGSSERAEKVAAEAYKLADNLEPGAFRAEALRGWLPRR